MKIIFDPMIQFPYCYGLQNQIFFLLPVPGDIPDDYRQPQIPLSERDLTNLQIKLSVADLGLEYQN